MKKVFSLLITVFAILFFVGCSGKASVVPEVKKDGDSIKVYPVYSYYKGFDKASANYLNKHINDHGEEKFDLSETLKRASEEVIFSGNKYFALINNGTNNLNGFPLTKYSDLVAYCYPYQEKKANFVDQVKGDKCSINTETNLKIVMFKDQIPGLYLWDANQTLKDLYSF